MRLLRRTTLLVLLASACVVPGKRAGQSPTPPEPVTVASSPSATTPRPTTNPAPVVPVPSPAVPPAAESFATAVGGAPLTALSQPDATIFHGSPEDTPTDLRHGVTHARRGKHYLAGNEKMLQAFYPHVRDLGGGYVGVGSDQAYLMIGWIRPEIAWLIDYDQDVVDVHAVYRVFFEQTQTPEQMLALWDVEEKTRAAAMITAAHPGERGQHLRQLYLTHRGWIQRRLRAMAKRLLAADIPSYLTDQETFDYVRSAFAAGRVRPLLANLLHDTGVRGVAQAAQQLNVPIKVLYLSNAEEYWKRYPQIFRDNVMALPFADDAKILRTLLIWDVNEDYRYNVQPAKNYVEWLARPFTNNVYDIVYRRGEPQAVGINFFQTDDAPDDSPASRAVSK